MKLFFLFTLTIVLAVACKKDINLHQPNASYLKNVKKALSEKLSNNDFSSLDFSTAIITTPDSVKNYLRIPFKGKKISEEFVVLKTNTNGNVLQGFIINLKKELPQRNNWYIYNGFIKISSLDRTSVKTSDINNGFITMFHPTSAQRSFVFPTPSSDTSDIVVTVDGGVSITEWLNLVNLLGGGSDGYYSSLDGSGVYGDQGVGSSAGPVSYGNGVLGGEDSIELKRDYPILIDFEPVENLSPIDINKYLKCFSNIPDDGSTCSIEILTDIPVDSDPNKLFNWMTGSPGHTFLQIKKTNGNQSVMQNIGFYPKVGWKSIATGPVTAKFVDNSQHEFNAGLKEDLTPEQLKNTLKRFGYLAGSVKYDIDDYNCTDFALEIFNYSRLQNPINIQKINIPNGSAPDGTNTPQELYKTLDKMQRANIDKANINISGTKNWVSNSNGPCN